MNNNVLHREPHVFLMCLTLSWLLGLVMTQHSTRTSLCKRWAIVLFSWACTSSWLLCAAISFSGASLFAKPPTVRRSRWSDCVQQDFDKLDTNIRENEHPINIPNISANIIRRFTIARDPKVRDLHSNMKVDEITDFNDMYENANENKVIAWNYNEIPENHITRSKD